MEKNRIENNWVKICLVSLALSGFYSIFIVLLRTPFISSLFDKNIFHTALIIHVDLSVLFWMLSILMLMITRDIKAEATSYINKLQYLVFFAIILMFISPLFANSEPFMNNYIPILHNFFFILGLALFLSVYFIISLLGIIYGKHSSVPISIVGVIAIISFSISGYKLSELEFQVEQHDFYEMFFWGGGHILQFAYCAGLITAIYEIFNRFKIAVKKEVFLWLNALFVIPLPFVQLYVSIYENNYFYLFTVHMKILGAVAVGVAVLNIIISIFSDNSVLLKSYVNSNNSKHRFVIYCFLCCFILFSFGGVIGLIIDGVNVTIPAHYHGSIVAITVSFMAYIYITIERNYGSINFKSASYQIILYSFGQLMHISALAYSGGYGALRKTPGVELPLNAKVAMGFMGGGGLLAIVAGLMFVYICSKGILEHKELRNGYK